MQDLGLDCEGGLLLDIRSPHCICQVVVGAGLLRASGIEGVMFKDWRLI